MALPDVLDIETRSESFRALFPEGDIYYPKIASWIRGGSEKLDKIEELSDLLVENEFRSQDVYTIVKGREWGEKLDSIVEKYVTGLKPLEFSPYHVSLILNGTDWREKLDWVVGNDVPDPELENYETDLKPLGFTPSHAAQILRNAGWREKIKRIKRDYVSVFKPLGYSPSHMAKIMANAGWDEKLDRIKKKSAVYERLGFKPPNIAQIVTGAEWDKKLDWVEEHYEKDVKDLGFTPPHISEILRNAGWREKVNGIKTYFPILQELGYTVSDYVDTVKNSDWEDKVKRIILTFETDLKPLGFRGYQVGNMVRGADWEAKLDWTTENYAFYREQGLTNRNLAFALLIKDWKNLVGGWDSNRDLFDIINIEDYRISPLAERYLVNLVFQGYDRDSVLDLFGKCNYGALNQFISRVELISGREKANDVSVVVDEIKSKFMYSDEEISMYLVALNKSPRGLLRWYNTGELYSTTMPGKPLSLDKRPPWGGRPLLEIVPIKGERPDDTVEREYTEYAILDLISVVDPDHYGFWERFMTDYGSDVSQLGKEEMGELNKALVSLRRDKMLLTVIYNRLVNPEPDTSDGTGPTTVYFPSLLSP